MICYAVYVCGQVATKTTDERITDPEFNRFLTKYLRLIEFELPNVAL